MLGTSDITKLIPSLSLGALTYQAAILLQQLADIASGDYQPEARLVRDILLSVVDYVLDELWTLNDKDDPLRPLDATDSSRVQELGAIIQRTYACLNYLRASTHIQSPPAMQVAIKQLAELHFPEQNSPLVALVVPQWNYNLSYISLTSVLHSRIVKPVVLDPNKRLGTTQPTDLLKRLCARPLAHSDVGRPDLDQKPLPLEIAIISFAGLDTDDALLYSLLAHELGHAIDFSSDPALHNRDDVRTFAKIDPQDVQRALEKSGRAPTPAEVAAQRFDLVQKTEVCLRELLADILATRMLGFSFFVAQAEFLKTVSDWSEPPIIPRSGYPGVHRRLAVIRQHVTDSAFPSNIDRFLAETRTENEAVADTLLSYLKTWDDQLKQVNPAALSELNEIANQAVYRAIPALHTVARHVIPDDKCPRLTKRFYERIECLRQDLPPSFSAESPHCLAEILASAWAYQLLYGEQRETKHKDVSERHGEYKKTCRLLLKAIELLPACSVAGNAEAQVNSGGASTTENLGGCVLSAPEIRRRLTLAVGDAKRITVVPTLGRFVKAASLDVRLGNWFAVAKRSKLPAINLGDEAQARRLSTTVAREDIFVPKGESFTIHPGDFVLGATLEFLGLPADVMAFVEGKSGIGRKGLLIATATQIAPGFRGVVVLELVNTGLVPLEVQPGIAIAQLVFQVLSQPVPEADLYRGGFQCQIKP